MLLVNMVNIYAVQHDMKGFSPDFADNIDHFQADLNTVIGVVLVILGHAGDAVVAVTQQLDTQAVVGLRAQESGHGEVEVTVN